LFRFKKTPQSEISFFSLFPCFFTFGRDLFFWFHLFSRFRPTNKYTHFTCNQIGCDGIIISINISSLFGFDGFDGFDGDERAKKVIDGIDESDSVVVDLYD